MGKKVDLLLSPPLVFASSLGPGFLEVLGRFIAHIENSLALIFHANLNKWRAAE